jgi:hypothetical protein
VIRRALPPDLRGLAMDRLHFALLVAVMLH